MKLILFFLLLNFNLFSQQKYEIYNNIKKGSFLVSFSVLPHFTAYQTFQSTLPKQTKILFGSAYLCFGISLDVSGIYYYKKAYKISKKTKDGRI
jgi:uncharacterized membrane protein